MRTITLAQPLRMFIRSTKKTCLPQKRYPTSSHNHLLRTTSFPVLWVMLIYWEMTRRRWRRRRRRNWISGKGGAMDVVILISLCYGGRYAYVFRMPLMLVLTMRWFQEHAKTFKVIAHMARDVLAIPGASVSVERLFSKARHICADARSSMKAQSITQLMCCKEWIRAGLLHVD